MVPLRPTSTLDAMSGRSVAVTGSVDISESHIVRTTSDPASSDGETSAGSIAMGAVIPTVSVPPVVASVTAATGRGGRSFCT